jgi:heme A synthase
MSAQSGPRRWAWWLLRLWVTVETLDAFLQPVFAGRFLSGDFTMLTVHRTNGTYAGVLSVSLVVVAIVAWRVSRVPGRIVLGMVVLGPLAALQIFLGFSRTLGVHVPLGVAMIALSGWLTVWMWTHHPAGRRTRREQR